MQIKAERIEGKYLKRGDVFSEHTPEYIGTSNLAAIPVYICLHPVPDDDTTYFRITIVEDTVPIPASVPLPSVVDADQITYDSTDLWGALTLHDRDYK